MNYEIFHQTMLGEKINTLQTKSDFPYLATKMERAAYMNTLRNYLQLFKF